MFNIEHIILVIIGGISGSLVTNLYSSWQKTKEYRALIFAFCSELVISFDRCVESHRQRKTGIVSYSSLFSFTDAASLSKLASSCKQPGVISAIIELKSMYFQIQPHIEEAAKFALQSARSTKVEEQAELMNKALHAQATGLAFFEYFYADIVRFTQLIINNTLKISPGNESWSLNSRFIDAKTKR